MANSTIRDMLATQLSPNTGWDLLRYITPALITALESSLPDSARPWSREGVAVATNTTGPLDLAGTVFAVEVMAGAVTGVFTVVSAAPATTEAQATYDANGVPTLNFFAADAVTEIRLKANELPVDFAAKLAAGAWL
jgi:hypothetical protein